MPVHRALAAAGALLGLLALGCASGYPVVMPDPLPGLGSVAETRDAVFDGIYHRQWIVVQERPGTVLARLELREHVAQAWVDYDADRVSFRYGGSENLDCRPLGDGCSEIHGSYNRWVRNLGISIASSIEKQRALRQSGGAPRTGAGTAGGNAGGGAGGNAGTSTGAGGWE